MRVAESYKPISEALAVARDGAAQSEHSPLALTQFSNVVQWLEMIPVPIVQDEPEPQRWFSNYYECPCGERWLDEHDCQCDDRCPKCNTSCSPTSSEDLSPEVAEVEGFAALAESEAKRDYHIEDMVRTGLSLDQARAIIGALEAYLP